MMKSSLARLSRVMRAFPGTFPGQKEGAMTGMRSTDGYGKRRVGTECEYLRGAQKKEENEGNALPGKGR